MQITVHDISYSLEIHQQDPTLPSLLLLHGFMGSGRAFEHLIEPISSVCNPVTIDLLGHGNSAGSEDVDRYSLQNQLSDLYLIINNLNATKLFLHGYSMGGRLALRFALRYPKLISGLILESTNYGLAETAQIERRKKLDEHRARAIENDYASFLEEWQKLPFFDNKITIPSDLKKRYAEIQQNQNPASMANSLRGFGTAQMPSVKDKLHQLGMPALLLAGELDEKYCNILDEMEDLIPNSKFHIIGDAGHRIHLEHPEVFLDQLKAFILCTAKELKDKS